MQYLIYAKLFTLNKDLIITTTAKNTSVPLKQIGGTRWKQMSGSLLADLLAYERKAGTNLWNAFCIARIADRETVSGLQ